MRASRLLSSLMLLQTRGRMSAQALAAELEVSVRTIYRDMDHLSGAGVPVVVERGATGGFELLEGWRMKLTGLTPIEAQALFVSGLPAAASQLGLGEALASAQLKLLAALPADWQKEAQRVSSRFHLDPVGWYRQAAPADFLSTIANAVWSERRLTVRYESWKDVVNREIDPLGLVLKAGDWYLVGSSGGKPHTYRVSNIVGLTVSGQTFARPKDFDLAGFWTETTRRFEKEIYQGTAVVRVSPRGRKALRGLSAALAAAVEGAEAEPDKDGWLSVGIPIESVEHAAQEMLKLGTQVEVVEPEALRQQLARTAREVAAIYAGSGSA